MKEYISEGKVVHDKDTFCLEKSILQRARDSLKNHKILRAAAEKRNEDQEELELLCPLNYYDNPFEKKQISTLMEIYAVRILEIMDTECDVTITRLRDLIYAHEIMQNKYLNTNKNVDMRSDNFMRSLTNRNTGTMNIKLLRVKSVVSRN
jgi:hypothetical protein